MANSSVFSLVAGTTLASADVIPFVDVSDATQSAQGSLLKITVTNFFATVLVPVNVTSASATSLAVGRLGATTPAFTVDSSTGSQVAGLKVTGAATAGTVAVVVTDSGANANLTLNAKGSGTIGIGSVSTGAVTITPALNVNGLVTLTGTGGTQIIVQYDGSNYLGIAVSSAGVVTLNAAGASQSFIFSDAVSVPSLASSGLVSVGGSTPASAVAAGTTGTITWDASYIYIATATNTWKRVAIATW